MSIRKLAKTKSKSAYLVFVAVLFITVIGTVALPRAASAAAVCYVDADAIGPTHDGLSWATAYTDLQQALDINNADCSGEIWVANGIYTPTSINEREAAFGAKPGVNLYGGFAGTETLLSQRVLHLADGNFTNDSILSGEIGDSGTTADNSHHVLYLSHTSGPMLIDGFVIQDGNANTDGTHMPIAGGMNVQNVTNLTLSNLLFRNNAANVKGAALVLAYSTANIHDVVFENNTTALSSGDEGVGGALYTFEDTSTITRTTFRNNHAKMSGGAAYFYASTTQITDSTFESNSVELDGGGAIYVDTGSPVFDNVSVINNSATTLNASGGGISVGSLSTPIFTHMTIDGNSANGNGGGINTTGNLTLTNSTISNNLSSLGGGMYVTTAAPLVTNVRFFRNASSTLGGGFVNSFAGYSVLTNVVIDGNSAIGGGGGVTVIGPHSNPTFVNMTIVNNQVQNETVNFGKGGGILQYNGDISGENKSKFTNVILWGNTVGEVSKTPLQVTSEDSTTEITYSDIQGGYTGTGNINADPLFVDPDGADNIFGTADDNLRLQPTSPSIDAGSNAAVPVGVTVDLDNQNRFMDVPSITDTGLGTPPIVDLGAYEVTVGNRPPVVTLTDIVTPPDEGAIVNFSGTFTDPGGAADGPYNYTWSFSDGTSSNGSVAIPGGTITTTHTFTAGINRTATLTVTDASATSGSDTTTFSVTNIAPSVQAGTDRVVTEGAVIGFNAVVTDPGQTIGETYSYSWNFGDGSGLQTGQSPSHTFTNDGHSPYSVTVTVTDSNGGVGSDTFLVTVTNVVPTVTIDALGSNPIEGINVQITAHISDPGPADSFTYNWHIDDGSTDANGTAPAGSLLLNHIFADNGTYHVILTVTDLANASSTANLTVTVENAVPAVTLTQITVDQTEGALVHFAGSFTDSGGAGDGPYSYTWNFGDGTTQNGTVSAPGALAADHAFTPANSRQVTLTVTDKTLATGSASTTFKITNVAPTINAGSDRVLLEGESSTFTVTITDPGQTIGETYTVTWNFNDGTAPQTGTSVQHTFVDEGTGLFVVSVNVNDNNGGSVNDTVNVTVNNAVPVVNAGLDQEVNEGATINLDGSVTDAGTADTLTYTWHVNDGRADTTGTVTNRAHIPLTLSFPNQGTFTATLTVNDGDGGSQSDSVVINVHNVLPTVNAGIDVAINEGGSTTFSGTITDPGVNDIVTYNWNFGDGSPTVSDSLTPTHTYLQSGVYTVTLSANDNDGGQDVTDTLVVTVSNVAPTVHSESNMHTNIGVNLLFTGSFTDPAGDLDAPFVITWNFGDGTPEVIGTLSTSHIYTNRGLFTVTLKVQDKDGGIGTSTFMVDVDSYHYFLPLTMFNKK